MRKQSFGESNFTGQVSAVSLQKKVAIKSGPRVPGRAPGVDL